MIILSFFLLLVSEQVYREQHCKVKKMDLFDEKIIEFVEARKYLYSSKDPSFKDRPLKLNSWESLSSSFALAGKNVDGKSCCVFFFICIPRLGYALINFQHSESNAMKNVLSYFSSKT
jgi:hypothetical protein